MVLIVFFLVFLLWMVVVVSKEKTWLALLPSAELKGFF